MPFLKKKTENQSDEQLMQEVCKGKLQNAATLFERYQHRLYSYFIYLSANQSLSEDLVQNTFYRVIKYKHAYKPEYEFKNWLYTIARNNFYNEHRKKEYHANIDENTDKITTGNDGEKALLQLQEHQELLNALNQLSDNEREILLMNKMQNIKYEDIALIMNENINTIKARAARALKKLKLIYTQN